MKDDMLVLLLGDCIIDLGTPLLFHQIGVHYPPPPTSGFHPNMNAPPLLQFQYTESTWHDIIYVISPLINLQQNILLYINSHSLR